MHLRTCAHTLTAWPNKCIRRHIATGAREWDEHRYAGWGSVSAGVLERDGSRWCGFSRWIGWSGHGVGGAERSSADRGQWPQASHFARGGVPTSSLDFGRMFPDLPPFAEANDTVRAALLEVGMPGGIMDAGDQLSAGAEGVDRRSHRQRQPDRH